MSPAAARRPPLRVAAAIAGVAVIASMAAGCRPEPEATPTPSGGATPSSTAESPHPTPTPIPTETDLPDAGFVLPEQCEDLYSAQMLASLQAQAPPLNDPGVTMYSSQNVEALELLNSGIPTIRCSWGGPSEFGLATNVSVADPERTAALLEALRAAGFTCESIWGGTLCQLEQRTIDLDDQEVALGEVHFVRGEGWVSTAWINFNPEGYTEDIVGTLWG